jgi:hypothetical protein
MKARRCRSTLAAMMALMFVLVPGMSAMAADKAAPKTAAGNIADRWVLWPKAGETKQFEAALKEHAAWRKKAGEPFTWVMYQPIAGTDLTYYVIRSDNHTWKEFDAEDSWSTKAKSDDAYEQQLGVHVARAEHFFEETDTAHSHWVESKDYKYVGVNSWRLKSGARGDLMAALDKIQKAITDEKWPYPYRLAWLIGGDDRLRLVMPMKSYAEMADPDPSVRKLLAKSLGSEDAAGATMKQFGSALEDYQYTVFAYRPDLSTQ